MLGCHVGKVRIKKAWIKGGMMPMVTTDLYTCIYIQTEKLRTVSMTGYAWREEQWHNPKHIAWTIIIYPLNTVTTRVEKHLCKANGHRNGGKEGSSYTESIPQL